MNKFNSKLLESYASSTTFHGPSHTLETKSLLVKCLWATLLLAGLAFASYQSWNLFQTYLNQSVLTSVSTITDINKPEYTTLLYCPEDWISLYKVAQFGISVDAIIKEDLSAMEVFDDKVKEFVKNEMNDFLQKTKCDTIDCFFLKISKDLTFPTMETTTKIISMNRVCHSVLNKVSKGRIAEYTFLHAETTEDFYPGFSVSFNHYDVLFPDKEILGSHLNFGKQLEQHAENRDILEYVKQRELKRVVDIVTKHNVEMASAKHLTSKIRSECGWTELALPFQHIINTLEENFRKLRINGILLWQTVYLQEEIIRRKTTVMNWVDQLFDSMDMESILKEWESNLNYAMIPCLEPNDQTISWKWSGSLDIDQNNCCRILQFENLNGNAEAMAYAMFQQKYSNDMKANTFSEWMDILSVFEHALDQGNLPPALVQRGMTGHSFTATTEEIVRVNTKKQPCVSLKSRLNAALLDEMCEQCSMETLMRMKQRMNDSSWSTNVTISPPVEETIWATTPTCGNNVTKAPDYCPVTKLNCHEINFQLQSDRVFGREYIEPKISQILDKTNKNWKTMTPIPLVGYTSKQIQDIINFDYTNWGLSPKKDDALSKDTASPVQLSNAVTYEYLDKDTFVLETTLHDIYSDQSLYNNRTYCLTQEPCWFIRHLRFEFDNAVCYEERFEYSLMSLVGNIGGIFGLFIGASLFTFIHTLIFCIQTCFCSKATGDVDADASEK